MILISLCCQASFGMVLVINFFVAGSVCVCCSELRGACFQRFWISQLRTCYLSIVGGFTELSSLPQIHCYLLSSVSVFFSFLCLPSSLSRSLLFAYSLISCVALPFPFLHPTSPPLGLPSSISLFLISLHCTQFLLFELKESPRSRGLVPSLSVVNTLLQKAKLGGIDLWQAVKDHSVSTN